MIKQSTSTKEIAEALHLSIGTVQKHRETVRKKLGLSNAEVKLQLILKGLGEGMVSGESANNGG